MGVEGSCRTFAAGTSWLAFNLLDLTDPAPPVTRKMRMLRLRDVTLDEARLELRRGAERVPVQAKVLQVLLYLGVNHGRPVGNIELLQVVWRDEIVTSASIRRAIRGARKALGDDGESQRSIKTVRGRGYQLVVPVTVMEVVPAENDDDPPVSTTKLTEERSALSIRRASSFVGRSSILELLDAQLRESFAGAVRCELIIGTCGMGKTKTLTELARRASERGAEAWFGRCVDDEGAPLFWPWIQALRCCRSLRGDTEFRALLGSMGADIAEGIAVLCERSSGLPSALAIEQTSARFRFFDAITGFLMRAAARKPLVLLFDDLHLADPATLRLLSFVTRHVDGSRLMIASSLRPVAMQNPGVNGRLTAFMHESSATCIQLDGLEPGDIEQFVELRTGHRVPNAVACRLQALTAGNPLVLHHLVHDWQTAGHLDHDVDWDDLVARPVAPGLMSAIGWVLGDLDAPARQLLGVASVLGIEFPVGSLARLAECELSLLQPSLARAVAMGILRESRPAGSAYRFAHALLRDALYDALPADERALLNARASATLPRHSASSHSDEFRLV